VTSIHFINLSNGLACADRPEGDVHFLRLQSTWCEQKRWADVLATIGPDFLFHLATNDVLIIHDRSERPRLTRALWQGVPWVRYACQRAWGLPVERALVRGGVDVSTYFEKQYVAIAPRLVRQIAYFGKYVGEGLATTLACECAR
jgi:hypothetical protein